MKPGQGNWDGEIDDLAIWMRALSFQEVATVYNAGLAGQPLLTLISEPTAMAIFGPGILMVARWRFGFSPRQQNLWVDSSGSGSRPNV
jgi:hypothetical protein